MEEEEDTTPFWLENGGGNRRRLRRSYSLFLSSSTMVIVLLVIALAFILVVVPTLQSFTSHVLKPQSVKKSWDSLNLVLVLFAIFCGFLSRNNNTNEEDETQQQDEKPNKEIETETPRSWYDYEYSDRTTTSYTRLRSFRSYPDLRQDSSWIVDDERWRFNDDTHVNGYREVHEKEEADNGIKNIEVDSFIARRKTYQGEEKKNKKASATKELFTSMKEKKKKKKKKKQSILNSEPESEPSSSRAPPQPPPPPPPSTVFRNAFYSKKSKHKKQNSVSPPQHNVSSYTKQPSVSKKGGDFFGLDENMSTGNESPLNTIPPPPPPPPFNLPAWKFKVQGDFVRIDSISSTSSGSPDLDDVALAGTNKETGRSEESGILLVYPKVDFDNKADTFIETFRAAGLRRSKG